MQKAAGNAEKVINRAADIVREASKGTESTSQTKDMSAAQPERKKIPFLANPNRKSDMQKNTEQPKIGVTEQKSVMKQIKAEQKLVPIETGQTAERTPQPKPSVLAGKYPRLKEIDSRLKDQNKAIFEREKKRDRLKKELSKCTGIFKGGRRKELQQEIDGIDAQISNMKKRLSSIVKEYKFDSVQAFYKELNAAKREYLDYKAACAEWEKTYGGKVTNSMSIKNRLRQKEQIVKERETGRVHQARQKDRRAR